MTDLDAQIAVLKNRIKEAQLAKVRAEAAKENAQHQADLAMNDLKTKFGVDNPQDARAKLIELQQTLQAKMAEVSTILDDINL